MAELMRRGLLTAKPGQRQPLPIVVLWGPGQSGKSTLMNHVYQRFYRGRPSARHRGVDLGGRPHEVALALADHLGRQVERFGRLKFPRLFLGVAAIRGPVGEPAQSREEMIRRTVPDRQRLKQWTRDTSADLLNTVKADPLTRVFVGLVLEGALVTLETTPLLRGAGLEWYREGLGQYFPDPVDALVDLAAQEAAGDLARVDKVLCRAFLADLRSGCSNRFLQLYDRNEHCLAVLDEADSPGVSKFFDILAAERAQAWDPLLIVAASSRRFPVAGAEHPEEWPIRRADQTRHSDWLTHRDDNAGWAALYPAMLDGLTETEAIDYFNSRVAEIVKQLHRDGIDVTDLPGGATPAVTFAHQLTAGHIGGLRLVLRAMTRRHTRSGTGPFDLRRVLEWPVDGDDVPLAEEVLRHILGTWQAKLRRPLLCAGAARDLGDTALARVLKSEPAPSSQLMREFRSRDMWVRHPAGWGESGPPALHPFARRVLQHQLANSRDSNAPTWHGVHGRLHRLAEEQGDTTSAMYHALAMGRAGEVAETLSELFTRQRTPVWFDTLLAVTQALLQNPARGESAESHCQRLEEEAGEERLVSARLVAALQLHSDPLGDPSHDMCKVIAPKLEALADHAPEGGVVFLLTQAEKFRLCPRRSAP